MKARVSPVQGSKPHSIFNWPPIRIRTRGAGFKTISGDHYTTAHNSYYIIPGIQPVSIKDGDIQDSSALAQSPEGDIEPQCLTPPIPAEINSNPDSQPVERRRSLPSVLPYDQSQTETMHDHLHPPRLPSI